MTWWTSQSCSVTRDVRSTIQQRRLKCCRTLANSPWAARPATGRPIRKWSTRTRWPHQSLSQSAHCGVTTARHTRASVAISSQSSRSRLARTATTQGLNWMVMQRRRETSIMSLPLERRRLRPTSQATTDSFLKLTSTAVLLSRLRRLVPETPLSSRTSSRTTR